MAAFVVGAVDQHTAHAHLVAHFTERDFLRSRCEHWFDFAFSSISTNRRMAYENGPSIQR